MITYIITRYYLLIMQYQRTIEQCEYMVRGIDSLKLIQIF